MTIPVAIVEDDARYAESVRSFIEQTPDMQCVAVCDSAEQALAALPALRPEVVLMDIQLPALSGVECVRELTRLLPDTEIVMLTVFEDYQRIYESLQAGATGYLLKQTPFADLVTAIRDVRKGMAPMSGVIARKVVAAFRRLAQPPGAIDVLSPREREVLTALAAGRRYKEVAADLGLSYDTVRTHAHNIYRKLHVNSRAEAIRRLPAQP